MVFDALSHRHKSTRSACNSSCRPAQSQTVTQTRGMARTRVAFGEGMRMGSGQAKMSRRRNKDAVTDGGVMFSPAPLEKGEARNRAAFTAGAHSSAGSGIWDSGFRLPAG